MALISNVTSSCPVWAGQSVSLLAPLYENTIEYKAYPLKGRSFEKHEF